MITLYGIKTCDSCRRAWRWLEQAGVDHAWHDLRADGIDADTLQRWNRGMGWQALLNRRSTTWRGLDEAQRAHLDEAAALALLREHPTLIRRPVLEAGDALCVGFDPNRYRDCLGL